MKKKGAVNANRVFLLSILGAQFLTLIPVLLGVQDIMMLQFLTEVFLVLPAAVYLILQKKSLKESIGVSAITIKQLLLLIPAALCVDKIAELFNLLSQLFTENEVSVYMADLITKYPFFVAFFVISMEPAICEEVVYRGVVYQGYRRGKILVAALVSAFLFGIMHMNLNQFVYAFMIGILFALINEAVGSIIPSMLIHMYINGKSVVLIYVLIQFINGLRGRFEAAELAGDTKTMDLIKELSQGIPFQSENWMEEYMMESDVSVTSLLPRTFFWSVVAAVALFFIIRTLAKDAGRLQHMKSIFRIGKMEDTAPNQTEIVALEDGSGTAEKPEKKDSAFYFVTPCLVIGVLLCFVMMFLNF